MTGKPSPAALVVAVQHARKYVVIEHEAARRFSPRHGPRQGMLVAKPHIEALEPEEKRKESAKTPSPTAIRILAASVKSHSFKRIARLA